MKIVAISDIHGNYEVLKKLPEYDLLIIAGDITNFSPAEITDKVFEIVKKPLLAVPGNCDPIAVLKKLENRNVSLHGNAKIINNIGFFGCGGANGFIAGLGFTEEEIREILNRGFEKIPDGVPKVLVSHAPPYGYCDRIAIGEHVGSIAVAEFIGNVDLIICGHIHEARGVEKEKGTVIVNGGFGEKGEFAEIEFVDVKFDVKLNKL